MLIIFFCYRNSLYGGLSFEFSVLALMAIVVPLLIIFGDLIPKVYATKNYLAFSKFAAIPLYWISAILFPLAELLSELIWNLLSRLRFRDKDSALTGDDIGRLAELGHELGAIQEEEHELISSMVSSRKTIVREIIIPRVDVIAIPIESGYDDVIKVINKSLHSRIPVYSGDLDNIKGVLYAKDLLPLFKYPAQIRTFKLRSVIRPALFVPATKKISDLMREFQEKKTHLAIVVDEYGGTMGLVTLEDVIEEIIGEIRDEGSEKVTPVREISENSFLVEGWLPFSEMKEILQLEVDEEQIDYDTVGGFVYYSSGEIPKEGQSFKFGNYKFTVKQIINRRIKKVFVEKL